MSHPILVTGGHRTGTTWVGRMLAANSETAYISEPLNVLHRPGVLRVPVERWYTYICPDNEAQYLPALRQTLALRYGLWAEILSLRSRKDLLRMSRDWSTFTGGRLRRLRPLLKDPFAVFSIPWFIERLGCQVVVTVRHPAAFASSLKRLDWPFQLEDLLAQPLLMRDWLGPYRQEMTALPAEDIIGRASLLWKMIYAAVLEVCIRYPQVRLAFHERISLDPTPAFRELYADLGLRFTPQAAQAVLGSSSSENPREVSKQAVHATRLDSRANLENWKRRLDPKEIERILSITSGVVEQYYPENR